jgi:hypothetical protein
MYSDSHSAWYALGYSRIIDVFNKSVIGSLRCCTASLAKHYSRRNHHLKAKWSNQYTKEHHENVRGNVWQHSIQPKYMSVESSLILGTTALLLATHPHTTPRLTTITISTHIRRTPQSTRRSYSFSILPTSLSATGFCEPTSRITTAAEWLCCNSEGLPPRIASPALHLNVARHDVSSQA